MSSFIETGLEIKAFFIFPTTSLITPFASSYNFVASSFKLAASSARFKDCLAILLSFSDETIVGSFLLNTIPATPTAANPAVANMIFLVLFSAFSFIASLLVFLYF